ncbi:hypothetical protein BOX24_03715 [Leptospirillum ferriphilum]|uniref:Uncharacterized protein n=1 Tax=Leptospirillum ferriphilum TaxID=178606 RepID=A0A1V3SWL1_9BACT|nr:hypothetical protein BOX24_03715 [Leptospirillum ferriphilum]
MPDERTSVRARPGLFRVVPFGHLSTTALSRGPFKRPERRRRVVRVDRSILPVRRRKTKKEVLQTNSVLE